MKQQVSKSVDLAAPRVAVPNVRWHGLVEDSKTVPPLNSMIAHTESLPPNRGSTERVVYFLGYVGL
jgi:hypothetical protein